MLDILCVQTLTMCVFYDSVETLYLCICRSAVLFRVTISL